MGTQSAPFEIAVGAGDIYLAALGSTFPDLAAAVASPWVLLANKEHISEEGIVLRSSQSMEFDAFRTAGLTAPLKAARTQEDLEIEFTVLDMSSAALAKAWHNDAARVTDTAPGSGIAGNHNMPLYRGLSVKEMMLLLRLPYSTQAASDASDFSHQWEIRRVVQVAAPEISYVKGAPVGVHFQLRALYDLAASAFGTVRIQDAAAT